MEFTKVTKLFREIFVHEFLITHDPLDPDSSSCHSCNQMLPVHSNPSRQLSWHFVKASHSARHDGWLARVSEQGLICSLKHVPQGPGQTKISLSKSLPTGAAFSRLRVV